MRLCEPRSATVTEPAFQAGLSIQGASVDSEDSFIVKVGRMGGREELEREREREGVSSALLCLEEEHLRLLGSEEAGGYEIIPDWKLVLTLSHGKVMSGKVLNEQVTPSEVVKTEGL